MTFDPATDYPLGSRRPDLVRTPSGRALADVTIAAARDGALVSGDMRATAETLSHQAQIARVAGRGQLSESLERAAELVDVPDEELLEIYTALRPGRSSSAELEAWAVRLEELGASGNAAFVREAAAAYEARSLLARG